MEKKARDSQFELLKIIAMFMIVSHHFVAWNIYNIDTQITGITINKLFLQLIGNHAFIGNNLFFLCSAWFLVKMTQEMESYPRKQLRHIWKMEYPMLTYSIGFWIIFRIFGGGHRILFSQSHSFRCQQACGGIRPLMQFFF